MKTSLASEHPKLVLLVLLDCEGDGENGGTNHPNLKMQNIKPSPSKKVKKDVEKTTHRLHDFFFWSVGCNTSDIW